MLILNMLNIKKLQGLGFGMIGQVLTCVDLGCNPNLR